MDPVTHFLTGACLGRAGFNRRTAYATLAMTLAAEAPDLDILWGLRGPVAEFEHHRGITHTMIGAPFIALAVTGAVWLMQRGGMLSGGILKGGRSKLRSATQPALQPGTPASTPSLPAKWLLIWLFSLFAVLSHLLLDYTNNYGLRPFFPFNPRWYSADLVFIFEPLLWLVLGAAFVIPALLGLADREIGARRTAFRGRGWAIFALASMVVLWTVRFGERQHALRLVENGAVNGSLADARMLHVAAEPFPINPFRWFVIAETADYFQGAVVNTRTNLVDPGQHSAGGENRYYKPPVTLSTLAAKRSWLGHAYLDWARFPLVEDRGLQQAPGIPYPPQPGGASVEFRDLRYAYSTFLINGKEAPLSGWVYVGPAQTIDAMAMSGHEQK